MKVVYLDNNATTQIAPEVNEAMRPFLETLWGNPSSMHTFGGQVKKYIDRAREQVAELIGAHPDEIIFTSCGSESNNTAIKGYLAATDEPGHIITSCVEHPAVLSVCRHLHQHGWELTELRVDGRGQIDLDELRSSISEKTAMVTTMWANNETGVIFPIDRIAQIVKSSGKIFHTDAVQAVGKLPVDVGKVPVDMLTLSGHKLHAPKGIGALYVRRGTPLTPLIHGGHQERGKRAGTENVPYIVGLGVACDLARRHMQKEISELSRLRDKLEQGILSSCPDVRVNGDRKHRLPNTLNVSFEFVEGEAILLLLNELGICASSGSACTSGSLEPSHVIRAMGIPFTAAHGSIRFSLSRYNTEQDIDYTLQRLPGIIKRLREISPYISNP